MADTPLPDKLLGRIAGWPLDNAASRPLAVAFSGGLDSTVLLAALCRLGLGRALRALHIDHGLHPSSAAWERHCRAAAAALGVSYRSERVELPARTKAGLEAAARSARYKTLGELLAPGEILLTAHHADDQLETLLLRMLRGAGVRGLRGIVEFSAFEAGYLGRPLLGSSRAEILRQAREWQLEWLEDPANRELRHDRNFLRLRVLPLLGERWPAAARGAERLAAQMHDAEEILTSVAVCDASGIADSHRVAVSMLLGLAPSRQRNLLRHLIRERGLPVPSARQLEEVLQSLAGARADAQTRVQWPGAEARVYRAHLYLFEPLPESSGNDCRARLTARCGWTGPEGRVRLEPAGDAAGLPEPWVEAGLELRFRAGGERFKPARRMHSLPLKQWLQERGIVPWMRRRIPLLYRQDRLVAVADLAVAAEAADAEPGAPRWRLVWTDHPPVS